LDTVAMKVHTFVLDIELCNKYFNIIQNKLIQARCYLKSLWQMEEAMLSVRFAL